MNRVSILLFCVLSFVEVFSFRFASPIQSRWRRTIGWQVALVEHSRHNHCNKIRSYKSTCHAGSKVSRDKAISFFCENCGAEMIKWMGRCPHCQEWNTIKEFKQAKLSSSSLDPRTIAKAGGTMSGKMMNNAGRWLVSDSTNGSLIPMSSIKEQKHFDRLPTFSKELDRVLGGGLVKGSVTLIAGEPGIGKSTLLLQLASALAERQHKQHQSMTNGGDVPTSGNSVVYLSGEENPEQIAMRSKRLHLHQENTYLICDVDIDIALSNIAEMSTLPSLIIIDSIQTVRSSDCENSIGSVTQIRESTAKLVQFAKATGIAIVLVGHVTKSGDVAGPRILEHMVDTVLYLEGSEQMDYRLVKSHKNRFGSVAEVGVFTMTEEGMQDVTNPSELFLTSSVTSEAQEGSAVVIVMEGSRPLLAEIQCLVGTSHNTQAGKVMSKRASDGFPMQRLLLICAVIEKRLKLSLWNRDVYLNVVGGLRLSEPTADCAVAAAIISSLTNTPIRPGTAFIGELGLGGELRGGKKMEQRISEAMKVGFTRVIIPAGPTNVGESRNKWSTAFQGIEVISCRNLKEVIAAGLQTKNVDELIVSQRRGGNKSKAISNPTSTTFCVDDDEENTDFFLM